MRELIWESDEYLEGSAWYQALKDGEEKGELRRAKFEKIVFAMTLMKEEPTFKNERIVTFTKLPLKDLLVLRKILANKDVKKVKSFIAYEFFKGMELTEENAKELSKEVDAFFKKKQTP